MLACQEKKRIISRVEEEEPAAPETPAETPAEPVVKAEPVRAEEKPEEATSTKEEASPAAAEEKASPTAAEEATNTDMTEEWWAILSDEQREKYVKYRRNKTNPKKLRNWLNENIGGKPPSSAPKVRRDYSMTDEWRAVMSEEEKAIYDKLKGKHLKGWRKEHYAQKPKPWDAVEYKPAATTTQG